MKFTVDLVDYPARPDPPKTTDFGTSPQAFRADLLLAAHRAAAESGFEGTDTAAVFAEHAGVEIAAVPSSPANLKITFPEDVALAERLLHL